MSKNHIQNKIKELQKILKNMKDDESSDQVQYNSANKNMKFTTSSYISTISKASSVARAMNNPYTRIRTTKQEESDKSIIKMHSLMPPTFDHKPKISVGSLFTKSEEMQGSKRSKSLEK